MSMCLRPHVLYITGHGEKYAIVNPSGLIKKDFFYKMDSCAKLVFW